MKLNLNEYSMEHSNEVKVNGKYIDRELSWIDFNSRVLYCAGNKELPLNERLKFLAITGSNLDEFISVRYSGTEDKSLKKKILNKIIKFMDNQHTVYKSLQKELSKKDVCIDSVADLSKKNKNIIRSYFNNFIFPLITPINIGSTNELPNLYSGQSCIAVTVMQGSIETLNIIPIPINIDPVYEIDNHVVMIEDIILTHLNRIFINKKITAKGYFRVIKDASIILDHDTSKFLIERMSDTLMRRDMSNPIFISFNKDMEKRLRGLLMEIFDIDKGCEYHESNILDYKRFMNTQLLSSKYSFKPFTPKEYEKSDQYYSLFQAIKDNDILLHHPYDSYDTVVKFIEHAALDPNVLAIKQTLYRVSSENSPIVDALCSAARNGKDVTVLIEVKARFDESRNISLISKLKNSRVNVVLGLEYLKTHCKMCVIIRKEDDGKLLVYSHIGTGNYNEKTAKLYTDLSYLTAKQKVGIDLLNIFNILSGISTPDEKMQKIYYAPVNLRKTLIRSIANEISYAKKGKKAEIFLKLNSLNDPAIINKLYEAADNGVQIYIICRGVTSIVTHKNIYIKSIVGRFLEHSRIYYFKNNGDPEYYISSADLLTRNLDKRVEILVRITDSNIVSKLRDIIKVFKLDEFNSFEMDSNGNYSKIKGDFNCHRWFIDNAVSSSPIKIPKKKK